MSGGCGAAFTASLGAGGREQAGERKNAIGISVLRSIWDADVTLYLRSKKTLIIDSGSQRKV